MNICPVNSLQCRQCSAELPESSTFCPVCGNAVSSIPPVPPQIQQPAPVPVELTLGAQHTQYQLDEVQHDESLAPETVFADRYMIQRMLGAGGMGMVYLASDQLTGTNVALKVVHPERTSAKNEIARLVQEGITARNIRHPNVVAVYDVGEFQGQTYISMEYLDGVTLRTWLRQKKEAGSVISLAESIEIIEQILTGLQTAHAANVIHRDLKPENIMIKELDGQVVVKILDFGIAKSAQDDQPSGSGSTLGSQKYMAPEQSGSADLATESADLYAVGVIFYELLMGVVPQRHWQPPSSRRNDVPAGIDQLIDRAISDYASARPQTATEFVNELHSATSGVSQPAELPTSEPTFWDQAAKLWPASWQNQTDWKSKPLANKVWIIVFICLALIGFAAVIEDWDSGTLDDEYGPQQEFIQQQDYSEPYYGPGPANYNPY